MSAATATRDTAADSMFALCERLFPIRRSLTGDGIRQTLAVLSELIPLECREVPSGTPVLDWAVPQEWNLRDAWIQGPDGQRVVELGESNLHVLGYSVPVHARMPLTELREHLYSLPDQPGVIPYRTSYWKERWGFCLQHGRLEALQDGEYEVMIDATLQDGSLSYGELLLPGERDDEVLIHAHICHPSLANDNLSGIAVATWLARRLMERPRRLSYRFVFLPGMIGPITWLALNEERVENIRHGLVLALLGRPGAFVYQRSRRGDASVDRAAAHVLGDAGEIRDFDPYGYDERQYCSPGFDLPVGRLTRTPHGEFPEYHTSADNLELLQAECLTGALDTVESLIDVLEGDARYVNLSPKGEPQLGRRGLYDSLGGGARSREGEIALLWVLSLSDGRHSLLDIAERSGLPFATIRRAADALVEHELLAAA